MNVGNELRQARQRAGLSSQQISQETKIQLAKVEALEDNAFDRLPDGIYLDGIVRAYARTVGLDGETMVQQMRRTLELDADEADGVDEAEDHFDEPAPLVEASAAAPIVFGGTAPIVFGGTELGDADIDTFDRGLDVAHDRGPAYLDAASRNVEAAEFAPPPYDVPPHQAPRRRAAPIALVVIALLAAAGLGGYLVEYGRRSLTAKAVWGADAGGAGDIGAAGAAGAAGDTDATGAPPRQRAAGSTSAAGATDAAGRSDTRAADARAVQGSPTPASPSPAAPLPPASPAPAVSAAAGPAAAPAAPLPPASPALPAEAASLSGTWRLDTRIESSSYPDYEGLELGYRLELQQDGARVTGTGVKTLENGRTLGRAAQTPITVQGTVEGERLTLTFTERGLRRTSDGKMILSVNDDGVLRGRFSSNSAQSVGIVEARRPSG